MSNAIIEIARGSLWGDETSSTQLILSDLSLDYIKYEIVFSGLQLVTLTQGNLYMTMSSDNGSTFITTSTAYKWIFQRASGSGGQTTVSQNGGTPQLMLINGASNASDHILAGNIELHNPMSLTNFSYVTSRSYGFFNGDYGYGDTQVQAVTGLRQSSGEAHNAIRIFAQNDGGTPSHFKMQYKVLGYLA